MLQKHRTCFLVYFTRNRFDARKQGAAAKKTTFEKHNARAATVTIGYNKRENAGGIECGIEPRNSALSLLMCELRQFRIRCSTSTALENELAETKAQLALCIIELDQTKAQLDRSNDNIFDLEDEINDVKNERNEAINRMDDAQDRFIEEHHDNARLRVAAESNLAIALQALAELRETHAAVLQELDELSAAVQVADQFIGIGIDAT